MASPRTKLPNSGTKRSLRRTTRVQNRWLVIFAHRERRAAFDGADAGGTQGFGRNEPDQALAALAVYVHALALDVLKEGPLLWSIDVPEAEIVLVDGGHLSVLPP